MSVGLNSCVDSQQLTVVTEVNDEIAERVWYWIEERVRGAHLRAFSCVICFS